MKLTCVWLGSVREELPGSRRGPESRRPRRRGQGQRPAGGRLAVRGGGLLDGG